MRHILYRRKSLLYTGGNMWHLIEAGVNLYCPFTYTTIDIEVKDSLTLQAYLSDSTIDVYTSKLEDCRFADIDRRQANRNRVIYFRLELDDYDTFCKTKAISLGFRLINALTQSKERTFNVEEAATLLQTIEDIKPQDYINKLNNYTLLVLEAVLDTLRDYLLY